MRTQILINDSGIIFGGGAFGFDYPGTQIEPDILVIHRVLAGGFKYLDAVCKSSCRNSNGFVQCNNSA
jgi:hypothetical protein